MTYLILFTAYYNVEFRESKKHIQQQLKSLESDMDRDVRENIFSAISEKEKTQPPTDDNSDEITSITNTTPTIEIEEVTATVAVLIATPDDV